MKRNWWEYNRIIQKVGEKIPDKFIPVCEYRLPLGQNTHLRIRAGSLNVEHLSSEVINY